MIKKVLLSALLVTTFVNVKGQTPTIVVDVASGSPSSYPTGFTAFNNLLYFATTSHGVWSYDGTSASDVIALTSQNCNQAFRYPVVGSKMYCNCNAQFYSYTGTGSPTAISGATGNPGCNPVALGNKIYYWGSDGSTFGLCAIDASAGTATNVFDKQTLSLGTLAFDIVAYNSKIYFVAEDAAANWMLYCYDPASGNTALVTSNGGVLHGSNPQSFHLGDDNKLYFAMVDSVDNMELFVIDGNNAPQKLTSLYSTNAGVYGRNQTPGDNNYRNIVKMGNAIYFPGNNGTVGYELMKYDLSSHATTLIKDINTGTTSSNPQYLAVYNGKIYFNATTAAEGQELWVSDGTAAGTSLVYDLNPGTANGNPTLMYVYNGKLYFQAQDAGSGYELYSLNAPAGIQSVKRVKDISLYPNPASNNITIKLDLINPENLSIALTDATGKIAYSSPAQKYQAGVNTITVPVQQLPVGIYQYRIANVKNELIGAGNITRE